MPGLHRGCTVAKPRTLPVNFPRFTRDHSRTTPGPPGLPTDYPRSRHGTARMSHGLRSSPDRPGCFTIFKTSGGHQGRPRIAKDRQGSDMDPQGRVRELPGITKDRQGPLIRRHPAPDLGKCDWGLTLFCTVPFLPSPPSSDSAAFH